jgi:prophage maintenance system killer protein
MCGGGCLIAGGVGALRSPPIQTWRGRRAAQKAATLLYLVTKNHSFSDGNKRIAAFLFLWFLAGCGILYRPDGTALIGNNTLVALTLMIAESRPDEMETMIKVVVTLRNKRN